MLKNKNYTKILIMIGAALVLSACANTNNDAMNDAPPPEPAPARPAPAPVADVDVGPMAGSQEELDAKSGGSIVYFAFDRYDVDAEARRVLQSQVEWLNRNSSKSITIEGHCDERGTREYNLALGDRRANAVKNYLVAMGVNASRVRTVSYGKERPVDMSNHDRNRRGYTRVN
jgi:peptidoglycan-associated lipoprotein